MNEGSAKENSWVDLAAGVVGGIAGIVAMEGYWKLVSAFTGRDERHEESDASSFVQMDAAGYGERLMGSTAWTESSEMPEMEAEDAMANGSSFGPANWGPGLVQGGVYGLLRGRAQGPDLLGGSALGAAFWLLRDELGPRVRQESENGSTGSTTAEHFQRLGARIAFGITAAAVSHYVRDLMFRLIPRHLIEAGNQGFDAYGSRHYEYATDL